MQINEKPGLTFVRGLRSIFAAGSGYYHGRRDTGSESAEIAVRLAYTGHLVLASLHTNDALGAVNRLVEMGIASPLAGQLFKRRYRAAMVRRWHQQKLQGRIAIQEVMICTAHMRRLLSH